VLAGAKTLVMDLWKVPDIHTQELTQSFYEQLKEEYKALDALKKARLIMKEKYIQMHTIGAHSYAKEMQILLSTAGRYVWGAAAWPAHDRVHKKEFKIRKCTKTDIDILRSC
jgi:CHAT domain-containing protein